MIPQKRISLTTAFLTLMALITTASVVIAWDVVSNHDVVALGAEADSTAVGTSVKGYWTDGVTPPAGYLFEDGSPVSRTTYANLFSVIGTTYGAGNGSTTFNLPDSQGRVTVARETTDTEFLTLGQKAGEKTHVLSTTNMPSHLHDFNGYTILWGSGSGNISFSEDQADGDDWIQAIGGTTNLTNQMYTCTSCSNWGDTTNTGSGTAHNNIQPYIVTRRAIKY